MLEFITVLTALPAVTWRVITACIGSGIHALQDKKTDPTVGLTAWLSGSFFGEVFVEIVGFLLLKFGWIGNEEYVAIGWAFSAIVGYSATDWLLAVRVVNAQIKASPIEFMLDFMTHFLTTALDFIAKYRTKTPDKP